MTKVEIKLSESYLKAKEKSPAEKRVEAYLKGEIDQAEYGRLLRAEVQRSEDLLLKK